MKKDFLKKCIIETIKFYENKSEIGGLSLLQIQKYNSFLKQLTPQYLMHLCSVLEYEEKIKTIKYKNMRLFLLNKNDNPYRIIKSS